MREETIMIKQAAPEVIAKPEIRLACKDDLEAIRSIYNHAVTTSVFTMDLDERTPADMENWLASHTERFPACVGVIDGKIIGVGSLSKWAERKGYYPSCEASIYLSPSEIAQGFGDAMLAWLVESALRNDFTTMISFMTATNKLAKNLVLRNGFTYVGVMKQVGYKFNRAIDLAIYQLMLKECL
jgi:L-amino acid N-acyltransferase